MTVNFFNSKLFFAHDALLECADAPDVRYFVSANDFLDIAIFDSHFFYKVLCAPHAIYDVIDIAPAGKGDILKITYMANREGV